MDPKNECLEEDSFKKVEIVLRPATADDLKNDFGNYRKLAQPFWIRSNKTGKFDNKPVIIDKDTNLHELKTWLDLKMIYVPAGYLEIRK